MKLKTALFTIVMIFGYKVHTMQPPTQPYWRETLLEFLPGEIRQPIGPMILYNEPARPFWLFQDQLVHNEGEFPNTLMNIGNFAAAGMHHKRIIVFNPANTTQLAVAVENIVQIVDTSTGIILHQLNHNDDVYSVAFNPEGTQLLTTSGGRTVNVWSYVPSANPEVPGTWQLTHTLEHLEVEEAVFDKSGTRIISIAPITEGEDLEDYEDPKAYVAVKVWDTASGKLMGQLLPGEPIDKAVVSHDGSMIATILSRPRANRVTVWDLKTFASLSTLSHPTLTTESIENVEINSQNTVVLTHSLGTVRLWDIATGKLIQEIAPIKLPSLILPPSFAGAKGLTDAIDASFAPKGNSLVITYPLTITIWDIAQKAPHSTIPVRLGNYERMFSNARIMPDGITLMTRGLIPNNITLWLLPQKSQQAGPLSKSQHISFFATLRFLEDLYGALPSPEGYQLAVGTTEANLGTLKVYRLAHPDIYKYLTEDIDPASAAFLMQAYNAVQQGEPINLADNPGLLALFRTSIPSRLRTTLISTKAVTFGAPAQKEKPLYNEPRVEVIE